MSECIIWDGYKQRDGYGYAHARGRGNMYVHRYVYEWINGPIPAGMFVLHSCAQRACVNPAHLRIGTHAENMRDMVAHGHTTRSNRPNCSHGHEFTETNTYVYKGTRYCRRCNALAAARSKARRETKL